MITMSRPQITALCCLICAAMFVPGCGNSSDNKLPEKVSLTSVNIAVPLFTQNKGENKSAVALINKKGEISLLHSDVMEGSQASWDDYGLSWSDKNNDYWIETNGKTHSYPNKKPPFQYSSISLPSGGRIGIYHAGLENKKAGRAILFSPLGKGSTLKFDYPHTAAGTMVACGNLAFAQLGDDESQGQQLPWYLVADGKKVKFTEYMRTSVKNLSMSKEDHKLIGPSFILAETYITAPEFGCLDNSTILGTVNVSTQQEGKTTLGLLSIDLKTKESTVKLIRDEKGSLFDSTGHFFITAETTISENGFPIINGDTGELFFISVPENRIRKVSSQLQEMKNIDAKYLQGKDDRIFLLARKKNDLQKHYTLIEMNKNCTKIISTRQISAQFTQLLDKEGYRMRQFLINPEE